MQKPTNIVKINNNTINKEINSKVDINSTLNHELQHKLLNIREKLPVKIDSFEEQKETNKIINNKLRNLEVNKMLVKNYVKKAAIVGIAAVAGMSLFACKKAEAPIPKADIRIDVDANLSDGNKINEKEVKTQINTDNADTLNNATNNGKINKVGANNTNNSVNKNGENIENNTNNSNKTEETKAGTINVGSIDINTSKTYDNTAEIEAQSKAMLNKGLPTNSYGYTKEDIDKMVMPDYIANTGLTEDDFKFTLERRDYLWEYMKDPDNFKVDYSLSDKEFIKKYGTTKTSTNGHKSHITGLPYTFGADGFPIEHPGDDAEITNPYNGKTYIYKERYDEWEDKDNPIPRRKATEEELNEIAAAYSASFK